MWCTGAPPYLVGEAGGHVTVAAMSHWFVNKRLARVLLYHRHPEEGWRYAIYVKPPDIIDGRLDCPARASAAEAQAWMATKLSEFFGGTYQLQWQESKPGWWTAEVEPWDSTALS